MDRSETQHMFMEAGVVNGAVPGAGPAPTPGASPTAASSTAAEPPESARTAPLLETVQHVDRALAEIRGKLDQADRESQHKEFSPARMIGACVQVLAAGFAVSALWDWLIAGDAVALLPKLGFALLMQLGALTAYTAARRE